MPETEVFTAPLDASDPSSQAAPQWIGPSLPHDKWGPLLIVEDDQTSRRILAQLLRFSGYETQASETAEEALQLLVADHRPRLALIDLDLPGMNGIELIRRLGQIAPLVIPILITATGADSLAAALASHPIAYLRKPIDFPRLLVMLGDLKSHSRAKCGARRDLHA